MEPERSRWGRFLSTGLCILVSACAAAPAVAVPGKALSLEWMASPVMENCEGPSVEGIAWHDPAFPALDWAPIKLPDANGIPGDKAADRFYRTVFAARRGQAVVLEWRSDDGSWVYLNGKLLIHQGGDCHQSGCVNGRCGNGVGVGGYVDLTPDLVEGPNVLAIHVSNGGCCGSFFDAKLLPDLQIVPVDWRGSEVSEYCEGPNDNGRLWHEVVFRVDTWQSVTMPDINPIPWDKPGDRFYRGYLTFDPGYRYVMEWRSDDGSWIYVNGKFVTRDGGECHEGGTARGTVDITPYLVNDVNVIAIHLSNMPVCCASLLDVTVIQAPEVAGPAVP